MSNTQVQRSNGGGPSQGLPGGANQVVPTTNQPPKDKANVDMVPPGAPAAPKNVPAAN